MNTIKVFAFRKRTLITADDDDEDELLKELGVSPISYPSDGNKKPR